MARRGDWVECPCGRLVHLKDNDRIPWHKKPDPRGGKRPPVNCHFSGTPAEGREALAVVEVGGAAVALACPACEGSAGVRSAPAGTKYDLVCHECGAAGTLAEFARGAAPVASAVRERRGIRGRWA